VGVAAVQSVTEVIAQFCSSYYLYLFYYWLRNSRCSFKSIYYLFQIFDHYY